MTDSTPQSETGRVPSPAATGGAGNVFEQHLGAFWLVQLLVGAIPPVIRDCLVKAVSFQIKRLGWRTDDVLIEGENGAGITRKLVVQAKRSFTVSTSDPDCMKTFQDFWGDYSDHGRFDPANDRLVLATMRGTDSLLRSLGGLLECARAASDAGDFSARLATPGLLEAKGKSHLKVIAEIVSGPNSRTISNDELWPFLRAIYLLSVDLTTDTGQVEAQVKSLLAQTANGADKVGAANATWDALVRMAGEAMPASKTLRRDDLPGEVRLRHAPIGAAEHAALKALSDHAEPILDRIGGLIGGSLRLGRKAVVSQVLDALQADQVVLISGPAGGGKSCVAKAVIETLAKDHFTFCFRGEEFGEAHFDGTLAKAQVQVSAKSLGAVLAGQTQKILLVESIERLLEKSSRDAFADLLGTMSKDSSWLLVLTCRDYSTELVRDSLLAASGLKHRVITVPPLDDDEISEISARFPRLAHPLGDGRLRNLLRNPYFLDRAVRIDWSDGRPLPQSERDFRDRFWRDVVRNGNPTGDMPTRRDACFVEVARRRAEALTPYADCSGMDREALRSLQSDSLIVAAADNHFAAAHDVLEDWALLRWIGSQYQATEGSARAFSGRLGQSPAIRRTFRKWMTELVVGDPTAADRIFRAAAAGEGGSERFNDDCLVALLQSDASPEFLVAHKDLLLADGHKLLNKIIHLLRVACFATGDGESAGGNDNARRIPAGPAWASVLSVVKESLASFSESDRGLLLGLIENWVGAVSSENPYPAGSPDAVSVALWIISDVDGWIPSEVTVKSLNVVCKVPKADADRFTAMLIGTQGDPSDDHTDQLRKIVLGEVAGVYAARDLPDAVCSAAADYFLDTKTNRDQNFNYAADFSVIEASFGINLSRQHSFFPPSAYRGPLLFLLRFHPMKGIRLVQKVFNHSAERYSHQNGLVHKLELPRPVTITFSTGVSRQQWCNGRLWGLYRSMTVGPYCLQSMLMALERWLHEVAESGSDQLDQILQVILMDTNSASVTAVVASIAVAYPRRCEETLVALLGVREFVQLDLHRSASENTAGIGQLGFATALGSVYAKERREADNWPHRRGHIETAIMELQSGPNDSRIQAALDRHRSALPPAGERNEEDLIWSLALDRMDRRRLSIPAPASRKEIVTADGKRYIQLETQVTDPAAKALSDASEAQSAHLNERLSLLMWATRKLRRENVEGSTELWHERLAAARLLATEDVPDDLAAGGPALVATVCVRDHWEAMDSEGQGWCARAACAAVATTANTWDTIARMQRNAMSADRACAEILPNLFGKCGDGEMRNQVRDALFLAVMHPVDEVRTSVFQGIAIAELWKATRSVVKACLNAAAIEAIELRGAHEAERKIPYEQRRRPGVVSAEVALSVLARLRAGDAQFGGEAFLGMAPEMWVTEDAAVRILRGLGSVPNEVAAAQAYALAAEALTAQWVAGRDDTHPQYEVEFAIAEQIADFVLRAPDQAVDSITGPVLKVVGRCPEETGRFVDALIRAEDRYRQGAKFWRIWEAFATAALSAPWVRTLDWEHPTGRELLAALFLTETPWNDGLRHWRCLDGFADRIDAFYDRLPAVPLASELYLLYLVRIGERSLPDGFQRVAARLRAADPTIALANDSARDALETILGRFVYGKPLELKSRASLRESVGYLLDRLVDAGSSAAFKMRDDFATPMPSAHA